MNAMSNRRKIKKAAVFLAAAAIGLLLGEAIVRISDVDFRYVEKNLYYQGFDLQSHVVDADPEIFYRLKPGSTNVYEGAYGAYEVNIDADGARGKTGRKQKPDGVYKILCIGGSNVYGLGVDDDSTWPAQLEKSLNEKSDGGFEVINLGTCAYVGVQMARIAKDALEKYDPDLILFALSNFDSPAFLKDADPRPLFDENPQFWKMLLPPDIFALPFGFNDESRIFAISKFRLLRTALLFLTEACRSDNIPLWQKQGGTFEDQNVKSIRNFVENNKDKTNFVFFVGPYLQKAPPKGQKQIVAPNGETMEEIAKKYHRYHQGVDAPFYHLEADGKPQCYTLLHPPAKTYKWQGEKMADWILKNIVCKNENPISACMEKPEK